MPEISVILPMYNEQEVVDLMLEAVVTQLEAVGRSFEIVCVDDGSTDATVEGLYLAAERDSRVQVVHFSRNFGKEAAMLAGLQAAGGKAVILMDADMQHPPDLIPRMIERWDEGYDVVDAVKADRGGEGVLYKVAAGLFYSLMGQSVGEHLRGSSDFKLLDRQVVEAVKNLPERSRFFRGLVAWVGFRVAKVPFTVQSRAAGTTSWRVWGLVAYSLRNIMAFSSAPLRMVAVVGFLTVALDVLLGLQTFYNWWQGTAVDGFTTVILTLGALCGLILLSLGVVAAYLAQMYEEQKGRPVYVVRERR